VTLALSKRSFRNSEFFSHKKDKKYKKNFGFWGEEFVDSWMKTHKWFVHKKNLKIYGGEIDRVYCHVDARKQELLYCISEIKTISCMNRSKFLLLFTECGISALVKKHQIQNLYKYADYICSKKNNKVTYSIYTRFFIVLKLYDGYENESFYRLQKTYRVCMSTQSMLLLSLWPEVI